MLNKLWALSMVMFISTAAVAADNKIYIEQVGDGLNLSVTQTGSTNRVGTSNEISTLTGDGQTVDITQTGDTNSIDINVTGDDATLELSQTGSGNELILNCGDTTSCATAEIRSLITGDNNSTTFTGNASDLKYIENTNGDYNTSVITMTGSNGTILSTLTGSSNQVTINQSATDMLGSQITMEMTGSNNLVDVTQDGTEQQVLDITTDGDNQTINIHQSN